ncbi:MAG: hypothetical protein WBV60_10190 [Terriglobales bacterium]
MRPLCLAILVFASWATSFSKPTAPTHVDRAHHAPAARRVVGALADVSVDQVEGRPVTSLHVLEFTSNWTAQETALLEVRLCDDHSRDLAAFVHADISIVYKLSSSSRSTGCQSFVSIQLWHDDTPWQTIVIDSPQVKRSPELQKVIRDLALPADSNGK